MRNVKFFIDTADQTAIKNIWTKLDGEFSRDELVGITTNPNAMSKVNAHTVGDFNKTVEELCCLVTSMRGCEGGVVYVQHPNSNVSIENLWQFARHIKKLGDGSTFVGLKIPPRLEILKEVEGLSRFIDVNVTGVADCSTAMMCCTYPIRYLSIIPGRMEEAGINADSHLEFLDGRANKDREIITGSMRTLDGLLRAIKYNTVPTIGQKVFDLVFENSSPKEFRKMWESYYSTTLKYSPPIDPKSKELSEAFFVQMDDAGKLLLKDMNE